MARNSELSGGTFVQPSPTLKESEGSNSSERYSPGCKALSSSGRGRGLASFSVPPQAASATTTSAASITSPKARLTVLLRGCIRRSFLVALCYGCSLNPRGRASHPPNSVSLHLWGCDLLRSGEGRSSQNTSPTFVNKGK